ncbi:MAG: hypothetical protein GEV07_07360 [Streptosporangiales bacterium]|nr:hypothetical protein [Streptosporangiales bacterium]
MSSPLRSRRSTVALPVQARPVNRDHYDLAWQESEGGVEAAQSRCSHLRGMARQMCYATQYGVSV